ncbi:Zn-dependent alcohol dehydrogenase [Salinactinospora qingdaonensis]|uniref:Zn-dependent alcohol dehydrogenase n=1 Tax=Salinactinospora qingdaonensis TaxID=702744 RepID=A0ABP7GHG1_9ACTN
MSMTVKAAVLPETGSTPRIAEITLPEPGPGQVRVRLDAAGVCHSDLSLAAGKLAQPVPAVLGHEGVGRVVATGPGVDKVTVGTQVVFNWAPACRECWFCEHGEPYLCTRALEPSQRGYATLTEDGSTVFPSLGTGAFAEETIVGANAVVPLPEGLEAHTAALLGCALLTGVGAVRNSAQVGTGESVAVLGLGGVGLATLQGARLAGAAPIIAVDIAAEKEALARRLGATHFLTASDNLSKEIRRLTEGRGVDHAFEVVGSAKTIRQSWSMTRRGGTTTVVGAGAGDDMVTLSALEIFHMARTLRGCMYGSCDPDRDIPMLAQHVRTGAVDLDALVTHEIALDEVPAAFERMREGQGVRSLIRFT